MPIALDSIDHHILDMELRMPFHFGNTTLTELPHCFVRASVDVDGESVVGRAAEGLVPLWFIKDPDVTFDEGLERMLSVIQTTADDALQAEPANPFDFWLALQRRAEDRADADRPAILWSFGVSLVERAVIDAFCRANNYTFGSAVRDNQLGIDLGAIHTELAGSDPAEFLPAEPRHSTMIRHTVGFTDPLTADDIDTPLNDGLPESLTDYIEEDGVRRFKVKLSGDVDDDRARLREVSSVLDDIDYRATVDANEQYGTAAAFRAAWETLAADPALESFMENLLYVEQPLARADALSADTTSELVGWDGPPVIIDESDGRLTSLQEALECGYAGTSHKNCKGVFKGIVNTCLIEYYRQHGEEYVMSGEDLTTVGPVCLLQDLAVMATLGIPHVERNGHHYFRGLSMLPSDHQDRLLAHHGDLYHRTDAGFPSLNISDGTIDLTSVTEAPFGYTLDPQVAQFTPLEDWTFDS